jgi:hypothetical protein
MSSTYIGIGTGRYCLVDNCYIMSFIPKIPTPPPIPLIWISGDHSLD